MRRDSKVFNQIAVALFVITIVTRLTSAYLGLSLIAATIMSLFFVLILFLTKKIKLGVNSYPELTSIYLLLLFIPISLLWTDSPDYGFSKMQIFMPLVLTSILTSKFIISEFDFFKRIYFVLFVIICISLLFGGALARIDLMSVSSGNRFVLDKDAINSSVTIANFFGFSLIMMYGYYADIKKTYMKFIVILTSLLCGYFLFYTGSRGPIVALFFSFLFFRLINNKKRFQLLLLFAFGLMISIINPLSIISLLPQQFVDLLDLRYLSEDAYVSVEERLFYYTKAINGIFEGNFLEVFFGHGLGDYSDLLLNRDARAYPHNLILEIGYELGLIALFLFVYLNIRLVNIHRNINSNNKFSFFFILYYYLLIRSFFSSDLTGNYFVFTFLFSIFLMYRLYSNKKITKTNLI